jgi:hypothetical protein
MNLYLDRLLADGRLLVLRVLASELWHDWLTSASGAVDVVAHLMSGAELGFETDIVVCELAHLALVDTDDLGLLVAAETEGAAREVVHRPEDDSL